MFGRGDSQARSAPWQTLALAGLVAAALLLCFLALTREPAPQTRAVDEAGPGGTTGSATAGPSEDATEEASDDATDDAADGATAESTEETEPVPPEVEDARRTDFGSRDRLPDGSRTFDNESVGSPMVVADGVLQHGRPRGPVAVSTLETELGGSVRKIGARVRFTGPDSGSVVLAAWQTSFIDSRTEQLPIPQTGLRLVAGAGTWELTASPADAVVASGEFPVVQGTATFEVYRDGEQAWVVDPTGTTTLVEDPRIGRLAGPFVCWQLLEREASMTPAVIESVWAG